MRFVRPVLPVSSKICQRLRVPVRPAAQRRARGLRGRRRRRRGQLTAAAAGDGGGGGGGGSVLPGVLLGLRPLRRPPLLWRLSPLPWPWRRGKEYHHYDTATSYSIIEQAYSYSVLHYSFICTTLHCFHRCAAIITVNPVHWMELQKISENNQQIIIFFM